MIKHIALFKLKESAGGREKSDNIKQIVVNVHGLRDSITEIRLIEVATSFDDAESRFPSYDLAVYVEFASKEDYDSYFNHPRHKQAAAFAAEVSEQIAGITYNATL